MRHYNAKGLAEEPSEARGPLLTLIRYIGYFVLT